MPMTALDPRTALVVIDLQQGMVALPTAHPIGPVVAAAVTLADAFRSRNLPIVLVNVDGVPPGRVEQPSPVGAMPPGWTDLIAELSPRPGDHTVTKRARGAFTHTDLDAWLKGCGVTQVVIAGVATSAGVQSTALHAQELGYNVTLAVDAMTDLSLEAHDYCLAKVFPRIGETGTTADVLALLDHAPA